MASIVSLDNQFFWTQPRRKPRTRVRSTRSKPIVSPTIYERSTDEPTCISNCKSTDGTGNNTGNAGGNMEAWQLDNAVGLPTMPLQPEFLVDNVARPRTSSFECGMGVDGFQQQALTIVSGPGKRHGGEILPPQLASPSSPSSTSCVSQSTPITTPDEDMLDELYPIDPALIGPAPGCDSTCYPLIDLDNPPDAPDTVSPESSLFSQDGPSVAPNCYASNSPTNFSAASNLSCRARAARSKSDPGEIRACRLGAANPNQTSCKRVSMADKEVLHVASDGGRAKADKHRPTLGCELHLTGGNQLANNSVEPPLPKRRKADRLSKAGEERDEESGSRCCSVESTMWVEPHASTPALSMPESPVVDTATTDSQDNVGMAEFGEWPLHNVLLKRITLNGVATFQLQFDWNLCLAHSQLSRAIPNKPDGSDHPKRAIDGCTRRAKFTPDEDKLIAVLKEEQQLPWTEIHRIHQGHSRQFPTRSKESLQVRYCTKLRTRRGPKVPESPSSSSPT